MVGFRWEENGVPYGDVRADRPRGLAIIPTSDGPASIGNDVSPDAEQVQEWLVEPTGHPQAPIPPSN